MQTCGVFSPGVHSSVEGVIVRWGMFVYSKICASGRLGAPGSAPAGERKDGVFLCLCLRTEVESVKRKSERALHCVGKEVYGCRETALGAGGCIRERSILGLR